MLRKVVLGAALGAGTATALVGAVSLAPGTGAALASATGAPATGAPLPAAAFSYPQTAPLDVRAGVRTRHASWSETDLTFAQAAGTARIHAVLVRPDLPAGSAVLFVHWLGEDPATTNLSEFMPDAVALAASGTTSLLVDAPWAQPDWFEKLRSPATDYDDSIAEVENLRRALDVLASIPGVESWRLAYVGHDFGAMYGAVLSGVDPRPKYYVLAAGTTTFSEWFLLGAKPADQAAYIARMAPLDPLAYLARSQARGFLLQFAKHDAYIPLAKARAFAAAAPEPKVVTFYDADHALATQTAHDDRVSWLNAQFAR